MKTLADYKQSFESATLSSQIEEFLFKNQIPTEMILPHLLAVASEARHLASHFGVSQEVAYTAGLLHDISIVIPDDQRLFFHEELGKEILPEEKQLPMLLHQQQSAILAESCFLIEDEEILSAIACHTTLKSHATPLDQVVFLADKIRWDRQETPPFLSELQLALKESMSLGCLCYLDWLFGEDLQVPHPFAVAAREELKKKLD
ncbi:bis(5'-nucleosyl)-tetraphosphatase (symmetrical) YqeK [Enterococcus massiliensis]|uniref:bis(5'-nucleosyl)-tetraphosphatase (symmetrical) YqeK n=1 Tax=Enterococcus massiliensis TaxID=1640685 RepID=UPI00065DE802|nr:bis(5'-nucleosyl)-tetraphosphatase (symmetrical) YqeK [Enterococcus massiliensis]